MALTMGNLLAAVAGFAYGLLSSRGLGSTGDLKWWAAADIATAFAGLLVDATSGFWGQLIPGGEIAQVSLAGSVVASLVLMPVAAVAARVVKYFAPVG